MITVTNTTTPAQVIQINADAYAPILNAAAASATAAAQSAANGIPYTDRAAFIAATIESPVMVASHFAADGVTVLRFVRDATGTAITSNGATVAWSPADIIHPDHFAHNTTPGTTDMRAAWQAAIDYAASLIGVGANAYAVAGVDVHAISGSKYYIGSRFGWGSTYDGIKLIGNGAQIVTDVDGPLLRIGDDAMFGGGDTVATGATYNNRVSGFLFRNTNLTSVASIAIQHGRAAHLDITDNTFVDFWSDIDGHRARNPSIWGNKFRQLSRTATKDNCIRFQGVYDSGNGYTPGGGAHVFHNEFIGDSSDSSLLTHGMRVSAVDGLYFGGNHFTKLTNAITIDPANTAQNHVIADVMSYGGNYFDEPASGGKNVNITGTVSHGVETWDSKFDRVRFTGDFFRGGELANYGLLAAVTDAGGYITQHGGITGFTVESCNIGQHKVTGIILQGPDDSKVPMLDAQIIDNRFNKGRAGGSTGGTAYVIADCVGLDMRGNRFSAETNAPAQAVNIKLSNPGSVNVTAMLADNDFTRSIATTSFVTMTAASNVNLIRRDNRYPGKVVKIAEPRPGSTSNYGSKILWSYALGTNNTGATLKGTITGRSTDTTNKTISVDLKTVLGRSNAGTSSVKSRAETITYNDLPNNGHPVAATLLTGPAWVTATGYSLGDVIKNSAGNVYLVITAGTSTGTEPTTTSGAQLLGARFAYIGAEAVNTVAVFAVGDSSTALNWVADLDFVAAT